MLQRIRLILNKIAGIKNDVQHAYFANNTKIKGAISLLEEKEIELVGRALAKQLHEMNAFMSMHGPEKSSSLIEDHLKPFIKMLSVTHPLYQAINTFLNDIEELEFNHEAFASLYNTIKRDALKLESYARLHTTHKSANSLFSPNSFAQYLLAQADMEIHSLAPSPSRLKKILEKCVEHQARMQIVIGHQENLRSNEAKLLYANISRLEKTINDLKSPSYHSKSITTFANGKSKYIDLDKTTLMKIFPLSRKNIKLQKTES